MKITHKIRGFGEIEMIWKWSAKKHSAMPKRGTFCF
jgi:hypothetical protein